MAKKWKPNGTIKSKLLPIEIAANDYWEASDDDSDPTAVNGKKRYFTWDEAMAIEAGGWRLPTRTEWMSLCIEFGEKDGDIDPSVLSKALKLERNGVILSNSLWSAGDRGYYWSSTADSNTSDAHGLALFTTSSYPSNSSNRLIGFSVRLVRDVKE